MDASDKKIIRILAEDVPQKGFSLGRVADLQPETDLDGQIHLLHRFDQVMIRREVVLRLFLQPVSLQR